MDIHRTADPTDDYHWEPASHGRIPHGAVPHGYEEDGQPIWVCRGKVRGGVHPGKVHPGLGSARIAWGGEEISAPEYEVLMERGIWTIASDGEVPPNAYPAGREGNGEPLYVARAAVDEGALHPGKIRSGFGAANIGYHDGEDKARAYEVLLRPEQAATPIAPPDPKPGTGNGRVTVTVSVDLGNGR